jgi:hypothetical protein
MDYLLVVPAAQGITSRCLVWILKNLGHLDYLRFIFILAANFSFLISGEWHSIPGTMVEKLLDRTL